MAGAAGTGGLGREPVIDALTPEQVAQLSEISDAILRRLEPGDDRASVYRRYDRTGL